MTTSPHHVAPRSASGGLSHRAVAWLTSHGISVFGSRVLHVRGRVSGRVHAVPVNPIEVDGSRYLVAPRGQTQWVRNLRVAGTAELRLGSRVERFAAVELTDRETELAQKVTVLRAYLKRYAFEVGSFFDGVRATSPDTELRRIAGRHPVFVITPVTQPAAATG